MELSGGDLVLMRESAEDLFRQCCIGRSVRMTERADENDQLSDGHRELVECCADPYRSLHGAAPLKPLPEPVDPGQYRVRKQAHVRGLINEYRLIA